MRGWSGPCSYIVSILIAMQYIGQLASRPWWQAWLGSIYPVLGVATLILLAVVNLRVRAGRHRARNANCRAAAGAGYRLTVLDVKSHLD